MTSIELDGKTFDLKRTMLRKETRRVFDSLSFLANLDERIAKATPEDLKKIDNEIKIMTPENGKFIDDVIMACFGLTLDELDKMENVFILRLFAELYKESTTIKKN